MPATLEVTVRMDMPIDQAAWIAENLDRLPDDVRDRILDQLWLKTALIEQRRRMRRVEREHFTERADRILALLDPQEPS